MRALVTGAAGFVGCHLVRALLAEGREVFGTLQSGHAPPSGCDGVRWVEMELASSASIEAALAEARPDRVYHLAAQASVGESLRDPLATWEVNATGTLRLAEAVRGSARLLFVSSAEVYGVVPDAAQPIRETTRLHPTNPYAASKAAAEMAVLEAAHAHGTHAVIARSFNHTGPGQDSRFALAAFARQLAAVRAGAAEPVLRVGNLGARRDYLDVRDVVRAYVMLLERGEPGHTYNVATGQAHSMAELVDLLVELSGTGARVEVDPARVRPLDVPLLSGDAGALRALGWAPEIPLRRTLAELLAHEAASGGMHAEAA
ncbi:MAG TPA: GDP-mannose 4,6-dehydratase [Longimicrobiaceae bacterium]|nr:GDP-mannose 4,6-dehydratase [Longimicrobiaceae bacterium]